MHFAVRSSLVSVAARPLATLAMAASCLLGASLPAEAAPVTVVLKNGTEIKAEQVFYTYTALVVITEDSELELVPNGDIRSVGGVTFTQAYWGEQPGESDLTPTTKAPVPAQVLPADLWPLREGTTRRYSLEQSRTTWIRRGRVMERRGTEASSGSVNETVFAGAAGAPAAVTETIRDQAAGESPHETRLTHLIQAKADGYYLMAQGLQDSGLREPQQEERINVPPRLWPNALTVGQTWTVGPFRRLGLMQAGRMEVVAVEPVTVPAGTYPDAYKVLGFTHVFAGTQLLKEGRLVTDNGTVESITWFVPGLGPVKEETKIHLHQDYFPSNQTGPEIPLVVEETSTRSLLEFQLGR